MPAYNAEKTLEKTYNEIYQNFVDEIILVDDFSSDNTKEIAKDLNITTIVHEQNKGYGGNQKSCYRAALKAGADIVIMLHPDYQYTPKLIPAIASMMAFGEYDAVIASRMLGNSALKGGNYQSITQGLEDLQKIFLKIYLLKIAVMILFLTTKC